MEIPNDGKDPAFSGWKAEENSPRLMARPKSNTVAPVDTDLENQQVI